VKKTLLLAVLAVALFLGAAAFATAASQTYNGTGSPNSTATGSVVVTATVNPKINLTITAPDATQTVNFGAVDPGVLSASKTVTLSVDSNKTFSLTKTVGGSSALLGLVTTLANSASNAKGAGTGFTDVYTIQPPFTTNPGTYNATVQYTVTQF
jgi:hypothetical protein